MRLTNLTYKIISFSFGLVTATTAFASVERNCYQFSSQDGPEASSIVQAPRVQTWCYQKLDQPMSSTYIYNADNDTVRPELALIVEPDGLITHGSLSAGVVTVHRVHSKTFNPFPIPLTEPSNQPTFTDQELSNLDESAATTLNFLLNSAPASIEEWTPQEGDFHAEVSASKLPWRGYWWPYRNFPLKSRLAKYDRFVQARTGSNPGAVSWESRNHVYKGIWWEGHCNGWAAASLLRAQPVSSKRDPQTGTVFSVSDQKAILSVKDYCVSTAFFGSRNRGRSSDNPRDINPALFHRTIQYYIGQLHKAVVIDYHADPVVDNHVVSGYTMSTKRNGNTLQVVTTLTMHKYDSNITNVPGIAPQYTRTYRYTLYLNSSGNVTGGYWNSANPDFVWVPLSPAACSSSGNPNVKEDYVRQIMNLAPGS